MRAHPALAAFLLLAGCATVPGENRLAERDPLEKVNRGVWGVNRAADTVVIKPVSTVYRAVFPRVLRRGISNFFANLTEPWSAINNLLQGKGDRAADNIGRFLMNSTVGLAGFIDPATRAGLKPAPEDFGQTLAKWGVNGGPYLVLPILGPSTLRDGVGTGVAWAGDPLNIGLRESGLTNTQILAFRAAQLVSARTDLTESGGDDFLETSLDPYAAARSAYLQRRRAQVLDVEEAGLEDVEADPADAAVQPPGETVPTPTAP